ncbi:uncharacterized protein LOC114528309 [Dendronephthya gigantea]|uniref:uncharacterized protein LOC114528309 n=1 Tax=Dendronephthya gigantea TaxID=151771 RepID=UPI00106B6AFA|nr:uncharacterized protein LOC114528309 [Dendronephthya gigantea]
MNAKSNKRKQDSSSSNPPSFSAFMKQKETERQAHFKPNKKKARQGETKGKDEVIVNIGLMEYDYGELKIQRGKSFPVKLSKDMGYDEVREKVLKKWEDYDRTFSRDRGYVLAFQDGKLARKIPGSSDEFLLRKYKEGLGKSYSRIYLYLCPVSEKRPENDTMNPITNWLTEEEEEIERVLHDSEDSYVDDCTTTTLLQEPQHSTSAEKSAGLVSSNDQSDIIQIYEVADFLPVGLDENSAVQQAINASILELGHDEEETVACENPNGLEDESVVLLIKEHATKMVQGDTRSIVVSRLSIWETANPYFIRKSFLKRSGMLQVTFATFEGQEDAVDHGGPRREFSHLLLGAMSKESGTLFNTSEGHVIRPSFKALQSDAFSVVGRMLATMIVQGGELPRIFSPSLCQYIQGGFDNASPNIDEVPDATVQKSLKQLQEAKTQLDVNNCWNACEWKLDIDGLPLNVNLNEIPTLVNEITKYFVIIRCKSMLDQFIQGLSYYGVLDFVRNHKGMAHHLFSCMKHGNVNVQQVIKTLKPAFSPQGNQRRIKEEIVMTKFIAFLKSIEDGTLQECLEDSDIKLTEQEKSFIPLLTPGHMLLFVTGAANTPSIGFDPKPMISFVHDEGKTIPSAQTCSNVLYLYVNGKTTNGNLFHDLLTALMNGGIFSKL